MSRKVDRAVHGPSWAEVFLGALLSLVLGVAIGAALLILRPVTVAKEEPKERARNTVYYIEGSRDGSKARQALEKRKAFVGGQSVTVTEEEINSLMTPAAPAAPAGKEKKAGESAAATGGDGYLTAGTPNVRVRDGVVQVGVPVTIGLIDQKVIAQARGGFEKQGEIFVYKPTEMYLGSCPVDRLPFLGAMVREKVLASQSIPEDIKTSWQKLAAVEVTGNAVKLTMP